MEYLFTIGIIVTLTSWDQLIVHQVWHLMYWCYKINSAEQGAGAQCASSWCSPELAPSKVRQCMCRAAAWRDQSQARCAAVLGQEQRQHCMLVPMAWHS